MAKAKKPKPTKGAAVRQLLAAVTGKTVDDGVYVGKKVYGRKGTNFARVCGRVTNTSICNLEGCGGTRLHVRWPDGHRTYPCAKGCRTKKNGDMEIR